jgi:hypothetical protein
MATGKPRQRKPIHDDFDGAWKNMLTPKRFADFIAFFLPDIHGLIDWSREVEFLEQELRAITRKTRRGHNAVDRLVKVWLKDGTEQWVLIHAEVQSQFEADFRFRMFRYYFRALDLFDGHPLVCLAILGDDRPDWKPQEYQTALWGTTVEFRFRVVKLLEYAPSLEALERDANPFARFVVAHLKTLQTQGDYESRLAWKLRLIQGLYDMQLPEAEIGQLCHDFDWLLALPEPLSRRYHGEMVRFEEEKEMPHLTTSERIGRQIGRKIGMKIGQEIGKEIGEKQGSMEASRAVLVSLGRKRFGEPDADLLARLQAIESTERLQQLALRVLDVESWQELLSE